MLNGTLGIGVRCGDGPIAACDSTSGFSALGMEGFQCWNGKR